MNAYDFVPCTHCYAFIYKDSLHVHMKRCPLNQKETVKSTNSIAEGILLLQPYLPPSDELEMKILQGMKDTTENQGSLVFISEYIIFSAWHYIDYRCSLESVVA